MFDPVNSKQSLPDMEEGILQYWKEEDTFKRSVKHRAPGGGDILDSGKAAPSAAPAETFSFYDGPPFATGLPHYGHILAGTIKDVIPRYQTMRGKYVERRFGWDCHGLPIENLIEQEHNITNKQQIEENGVGWFNDLCRGAVQRYTGEWRQVVERMGRWVDMDWDYRTMDPAYMESMWWAFEKLHRKNLIYEGHKPMHVCPRCVTPLSNFEVTQGYKDVTDRSVVARFALNEGAQGTQGTQGTNGTKVYLLAWTTTPWTLPGNLFLAVNPNVNYIKFAYENDVYIVAKDIWDNREDPKNILHGLMAAETKAEDEVPAILGDPFKGKKLIDLHYEPLFPYFTEEYRDKAFTVVEGDFVTTEDGTGIVHIAPGFGSDDFEVGRKMFGNDYQPLQHVTMDGKFVNEVTDFAGEEVKPKDDPSKIDKKIIQWLKQHEKYFSDANEKHSYPHCWRCDSPLLNYATSSWFVHVEALKDRMLSENAKTAWTPDHIRDGRYGNWLENARDWAISRNRYWGTPLPIWRNDYGEIDVIGSQDDLMQKCQMRFTKLTAVRHGESEGNCIPIYQGEEPGTDLTDNGRAQARATAEHMREETVDIVYCSPLARTRQTAEIIAEELGAELVIDDRLREVRFGEYEGKTVDFTDLSFLKARRAHKLEQGTPESIYHFEGMETWADVSKRITDFMHDVLPRHRSEHIVVVTHADPVQNIRAFFSGEDPIKLSHQPFPTYAQPFTFFWDHERQTQMDLHKDTVDDIVWSGTGDNDSVDVTLVRHGQTDWNASGTIQGWSDSRLNEAGRQQAEEVAASLSGADYDVLLCSDLARAAETADIISKHTQLPVTEKLELLRERSYGDGWEGRQQDDILAEHPYTYPEDHTDRFSLHEENGAGGETMSDFLRRARQAYEYITEHYAGKRVLLVSHGGMIRALQTVSENLSLAETKNIITKNTEVRQLRFHQPLRRIPDVLDCWFESGSMPYAQQHFPFEKGDRDREVPKNFPADFIAEGLDQTRAWFYTLMVLSVALFDETPFKNVIVNGIVLAEDGKKMSKRLQNYPDPMEVVQRHGADAVRFTLMSSPAVRAEDLRFSEKLVEETVRGVLLPLWNTYSFFVTYANAAGFEPVDTREHSDHPLDQWIRAEVQDLANRMTTQLDSYDLSATCAQLHETIDALTNWYIRLSRRRFAGKGVMDEYVDTSGDAEAEDQHDALHTLHDVLLTLSQLLAPFCPYITEAMYLNLIPEEHGSVHFTDWPTPRDLSATEQQLIHKTRLMRLVVSLGNSIRGEQKVKNRQPLAQATIALPPDVQEQVQFTNDDLDLLRQELNVKTIEFARNPEELAEAYVQVNARVAGPRLGSRVQEIIAAGKQGEFSVAPDGTILVLDEKLTADEAGIVYRSKGDDAQGVAADRGVVVQLDTAITDELRQEGQARDLIRAVQRLRKEQGLHFTDRIALHITGLPQVVEEFRDLLTQETRAELRENNGEPHEVTVGDETVTVQFEKL